MPTRAAGVALVALAAAPAAVRATGPRSKANQSLAYLLERTASARPAQADPAFDCAWRAMALQYAPTIHPHLTAAQHQDLYDALQLHGLCNQTYAPLKQRPARAASDAASPIPSATTATTIYADAQHGSDTTGDGSLSNPFASLPMAVAAARTARVQDPSATLVIDLRGGTYRLSAPVALGEADSGLTIQGHPGEEATVTGNTLLDAAALDWRLATPSSADVVDSWETFNDQNEIFGECDTPTTCGSGVRLVGVFDDVADCRTAINSSSTPGYPFATWTYHHPSFGGDFASHCFGGTEFAWHAPTPQKLVDSGRAPGRYNPTFASYVADVSSFGLSEVPALRVGGQRAWPARFPNANAELDLFPIGYITADTAWAPPLDAAGNPCNPNTQCGVSENLTIAVDPGEWHGMFQNYTVGVGGACARYDPPYSPWCSGDFYLKRQFPEMHTRSPSGAWVGTANLPHVANYTHRAGARVHAWRPGHWYTWMFDVAALPAAGDNSGGSGGGEEQSAQQAPATPSTLVFAGGGTQGGEGNEAAGEWFVENVLAELDDANEFFFDATAQRLYFAYNGTTAPPASLSFEVPQLRNLFDLRGASPEAPISDVTLTGLTFTGTRPTFMDPRGNPSGGDWSLERSGALQLENTVNVTLSASLFTRLDSNAVSVNGFNRGLAVVNNEAVWLAQNFVAAWGRADGNSGMAGIYPRGTRLTGNFVHEIGHIQKQSSFYFQAEAAETYIADNLVFNIPRAAINFNDGFGGGNEIARNLLFNTCRESSDHGAFNSWDRLPYVTDVRQPGTPSTIPAVTKAHKNFIVANYAADGGCLDNDDGSSYYDIFDNFCVYGGHKGDFDGNSKRSFRNIAAFPSVYGTTCVGISAQALPPAGYAEAYFNNTCILPNANNLYLNIPGNLSQPTAFRDGFNVGNNTVYVPSAEAKVKVGDQTISFDDFQQKYKMDPGTVVLDSAALKAETIIGWAKAVLGLSHK